MNREILTINPGGSSTKLALFRVQGQELNPMWQQCIAHKYEHLSLEQDLQRRLQAIERLFEDMAFNPGKVEIFVGRGGPLQAMHSGEYLVDEAMVSFILEGRFVAYHPSLLGALLAYQFAHPLGKRAIIVDPVSVDELIPEARLSGHPSFKRTSFTHALSLKAACRRFAREQHRDYSSLNLVAAHLGSGVSVTAHRQGRMIDVNDSSSEGPFSTQRCGGLPVRPVVKWLRQQVAEGNTEAVAALEQELVSGGGLLAYRGKDDFRQLLEEAAMGDPQAELCFRAMVHQIRKEVGAYLALFNTQPDAIIFTGGLCHAERVQQALKCLSWIAPLYFYPGEEELEALAQGGQRVLRGATPLRFVPKEERRS